MKDKLISFGFVGILVFFMIFSFILKDLEVSVSERRILTKFPNFTLTALWNGDYFDKLDSYFVDHFPFREEFRKIKGVVANSFFQKKENEGIFLKDHAIYQLAETLDYNSINYFTDLLKQLDQKYFEYHSVYYAIIPDKNYYLEDHQIPRFPYSELFDNIRSKLPDSFQEIDITQDLDLDSYYRTDIHWKQEKLEKVVNTLADKMHLDIQNYPNISKTYSQFYGALYGRIANDLDCDTITYLTSPILEETQVYNYEKNRIEKVYEEENLTHIDSYDIYLSGATPLLILTNPNQEQERELILFRDSFGSSITPLLVEAYSKITVIDLRYFRSNLIEYTKEIDFSNPNLDVLFLYSIPIINNSFTLK